ncbi:MAG: hypothetical protein ACREBS_11095 [Nitrososphaerales archaeon]
MTTVPVYPLTVARPRLRHFAIGIHIAFAFPLVNNSIGSEIAQSKKSPTGIRSTEENMGETGRTSESAK